MSDFLDTLERDLVAAARRRRDARRAALALRLRRRLGVGRLAAVAALLALVGSATTAAAFAVLRGSVIPGPAAHDVPRDQLPEPGTIRLAGVRAADPDPAAPPWTLRLARSRTGLLCTTVGQLVDGRFGLIGLDGRFRAYDRRIVDSCGAVGGPGTALVGARVFDAAERDDVRTVVNGVGGKRLRRVTVETANGRARRVPVRDGGAFVTALRGYPEDSGIAVTLRFAGGHEERHAFGRSPYVVPDPDRGGAWRSTAFVVGNDARNCVSFAPARLGAGPRRSPAACGVFESPTHRRGYFFAVRRIMPGTGRPNEGPFGDGDWGAYPPRTAVWGGVGGDVARIEIHGPAIDSEPEIAVSRTFFAVFGPKVDPADLTVRVVFRDGHVEQRRGSANLVQRKAPSP